MATITNTAAALDLLVESVTALTDTADTRENNRAALRHIVQAADALLAQDGTADLRRLYQALEDRASLLRVWDVADQAQRFLDAEDRYRARNGL